MTIEPTDRATSPKPNRLESFNTDYDEHSSPWVRAVAREVRKLPETALCRSTNDEKAPSEKPDVPAVEKHGWKRPEAKELSASAEKRMKDMQDFTMWLKENFDKIDTSKSGSITREDVAKKILDPKFANETNAPRLAAFYSSIDELIERYSGKPEKNGFTKDGLEKLQKVANDKDFFRKSDRSLAVRELGAIFSFLDTTDKSSRGKLTPDEVDKALF